MVRIRHIRDKAKRYGRILGLVVNKMMPKAIVAGVKSGMLKEITLAQAERYSRNEQMLQRMRAGRLNIKAYWDEEERMVRFGMRGAHD